MSTHQHLARSAGVFTSATLLSRILGYARDSLVANFFGAGIAADAFYAAFRISNLFRRLLGEGALAASFIPVFSEYSQKEGEQKTKHFFHATFTVLFVLLAVVTALGIYFSPQITSVIAKGFKDTPDRFALAVTLTQSMFPFLLFISLAALVSGVLNTYRIFFIPALAPATLSVTEITFLLALAPALSPQNQVIGLAMSVAVGGFLQLAIQIPVLWKAGFTLRWRWEPKHPGVQRVGKLMVPVTLGSSVDQINAFFDTFFASFLAQGSVTALYYSNRVMQLPLALFGIALSQVSLPSMAASAARGDMDHLKDTLNFSLRLTLFMIVPASVGLIVLGRPIVQVLFEHGAFTPQATDMTTFALFFFSIGLVAYASVKILANVFYALQNTRIPAQIAAGCVALNIVLSAILMHPLQVGGLALASAVSSWTNAILLFYFLRKRLGLLGGHRILMTLFKSFFACVAMAGYCLAIYQIPWDVHAVVRLSAGIGGGAAVYLAMAHLFRMEEWPLFRAQLKRR